MEKARNVEGKQTDHGWNRLAGLGMQAFNVVILVALTYRVLSADEAAEESTLGKKVSTPHGGTTSYIMLALFAVYTRLLICLLLLEIAHSTCGTSNFSQPSCKKLLYQCSIRKPTPDLVLLRSHPLVG